MLDINALINTVPQLLDPSISIKLVEVAKKYNTPEVSLVCVAVYEIELNHIRRECPSLGYPNILNPEGPIPITARKVSSSSTAVTTC